MLRKSTVAIKHISHRPCSRLAVEHTVDIVEIDGRPVVTLLSVVPLLKLRSLSLDHPLVVKVETALHYAAKDGNLRSLDLLVKQYRADVNVQSKKQTNRLLAYHHVTYKLSTNVIGWSGSSDSCLVLSRGSTPLHIAVAFSQRLFIRCLLEVHHARNDVMDYSGRFPLHLLSPELAPEFQTLLSSGRLARIRDNYHKRRNVWRGDFNQMRADLSGLDWGSLFTGNANDDWQLFKNVLLQLINSHCPPTSFFQSVYTNEARFLPPSTEELPTPSVSDILFSEGIVRRELEALNESKSPRPDEIPPKLLKELATARSAVRAALGSGQRILLLFFFRSFARMSSSRLFNEKTISYHFSNTTPDKTGFLWKKPSDGKRPFKKRYFVLSGNMLVYSEHKDDKEPLGLILLEGHFIELLEGCTFAICFTGEGDLRKNYVLRAENDAEAEAWMQALAHCGSEFIMLSVEELEDQLRALTSADDVPSAPPRMTGSPPKRNPFNPLSQSPATTHKVSASRDKIAHLERLYHLSWDDLQCTAKAYLDEMLSPNSTHD
nr:unnamed protein product [Spirometra erinaceieuropaei]